MDLTNVIGKIVDIDWIKSKTMWVSIVFDIIYAGLTFAVFVVGELPLDQGASIAAALGMIQSQMMKYMRMITKTGILPVNPQKRALVIEEEFQAQAAIKEKSEKNISERNIKTGALEDEVSWVPPAVVLKTDIDRPVVEAFPSTLISAEQYFGKKLTDVSMINVFSKEQIQQFADNADDLITKVNVMLRAFYLDTKLKLEINPNTGTLISGSLGGFGDGGFRLPNSTTGAKGSSHRVAKGVDISDMDGDLDNWLDEIKLAEFGLWKEDAAATRSWCHATTRPQPSFKVTGKRIFTP